MALYFWGLWVAVIVGSAAVLLGNYYNVFDAFQQNFTRQAQIDVC